VRAIKWHLKTLITLKATKSIKIDNLATHCMSLLNTTSLKACKHPLCNEGRGEKETEREQYMRQGEKERRCE